MNAATAAGSKTTKGPPVSDQKTTEVRGKALYLEFHNNGVGKTFQLLVQPDGTTTSGAYIPFGMFHRTLTPAYPKRPWSVAKVQTARVTRVPDPITLKLVPIALTDGHEALRIADLFQKHVTDVLDQLNRQGFTLFKQPVVVEISSVDFDELGNGNTPYALFRRVMSARKTLGFPDDLLPTSSK